MKVNREGKVSPQRTLLTVQQGTLLATTRAIPSKGLYSFPPPSSVPSSQDALTHPHTHTREKAEENKQANAPKIQKKIHNTKSDQIHHPRLPDVENARDGQHRSRHEGIAFQEEDEAHNYEKEAREN